MRRPAKRDKNKGKTQNITEGNMVHKNSVQRTLHDFQLARKFRLVNYTSGNWASVLKEKTSKVKLIKILLNLKLKKCMHFLDFSLPILNYRWVLSGDNTEKLT